MANILEVRVVDIRNARHHHLISNPDLSLQWVGNHSPGIGDGSGFRNNTTLRRSARQTTHPGKPKKTVMGTSTITAWITNRTIEAAVSTASPNARFMVAPNPLVVAAMIGCGI